MRELTPVDRVRATLDLTALGEQMLRARLHRENPGITDAQVQAVVDGWYTVRPGAQFGDCAGSLSDRRL